ncbi:MAG: hypothetical protein J1F35_08395 [Erysipelotrichales bacterium]|nr:hypothetical protein [Erysipelotrichales bacterium]
MGLVWSIWCCLIFVFVGILIIGIVFEKNWLVYIGLIGFIFEILSIFILMIITAYPDVIN